MDDDLARGSIFISIGDLMRTAHRDNPCGAAGSMVSAEEGSRATARYGRRRWRGADLHYLRSWVGTRPIRLLCRHLHRTERALRCKLHELGLSAKVREGWGMAQLRRTCHASLHTVLRDVAEGRLRLQCAQVHLPPDQSRSNTPTFSAGERRRRGMSYARVLPIGEVAARQHQSIAQLCAAALVGHWRVIHLRITEETALQFYATHRRPRRVIRSNPRR